MDRRDFLKSMGAAGAVASLPNLALANEDAPKTLTTAAYARLIDAMHEAERRYLGPEHGVERPSDIADGHRFLLHVLNVGMTLHLEADPRRPRFLRIVTPTRKLLGDNPDAIYYQATVEPSGTYRIRGNVAGAVYVSFTVEDGTRDGGYSTDVSATINSDQFDVDADGSFEVVAGGPERERNWIPLGKDAGTITTRSYFEDEISVANQPNKLVPMTIERSDDVPPPPTPDDASIAESIDRVRRYFSGITFERPPMHDSPVPPWVSRVPNQFNAPAKPGQGIGYAAVDNAYAMAPYLLKPGEALVVEGRFPDCRFANVVLWTRFLQTYDYANRTVSLNRKQTKLRSDGSFAIVLAAEDPGVPNWLDTEGRPFGMVYWRFLLPKGPIETPKARVVPIETLRG